MLAIDCDGNIKVNKGDTFKVPLFIDISKDIFKSIRLPLRSTDKIIFNLLMGNNCFCCPLIHKEFTLANTNENQDIIISFEHDDTACFSPGIYYYEIKFIRQIENEEDKIITIVPRRKFTII